MLMFTLMLMLMLASLVCRSVASLQTGRLGTKIYWFDHSATCNKLCAVGLSLSLKSSKVR